MHATAQCKTNYITHAEPSHSQTRTLLGALHNIADIEVLLHVTPNNKHISRAEHLLIKNVF